MLLLLPLMVVVPLDAPGPLVSGSCLTGTLGQCPLPHRSPLQPCDLFCSSDQDCVSGERCCSTGCGQECRLPVGAKRGFCPRLNPDVATICRVECGSDSECRGKQKCCSVGCHMRCVQLVPAKPGVCPRRKVLQTFAPCKSTCHDDTDCPLHEKCCFTGCGRGCLPPNGSLGDICHLPPVPGTCRGHFLHYAYYPARQTCQPFTYSGCGGNRNNFRTVKECQQTCQLRDSQGMMMRKRQQQAWAHPA